MDHQEAKLLLTQSLLPYRQRSYELLRALLHQEEHLDVVGPSGTSYQVEILFLWDAQPSGYIRVMASIDDGGWRAFLPLTDSFILTPQGTFLGEEVT